MLEKIIPTVLLCFLVLTFGSAIKVEAATTQTNNTAVSTEINSLRQELAKLMIQYIQVYSPETGKMTINGVTHTTASLNKLIKDLAAASEKDKAATTANGSKTAANTGTTGNSTGNGSRGADNSAGSNGDAATAGVSQPEGDSSQSRDIPANDNAVGGSPASGNSGASAAGQSSSWNPQNITSAGQYTGDGPSTAKVGDCFSVRLTSYMPGEPLPNGTKEPTVDMSGKHPVQTVETYLVDSKQDYVSIATGNQYFKALPYGTYLDIPVLDTAFKSKIRYRRMDTGGALNGTNKFDVAIGEDPNGKRPGSKAYIINKVGGSAKACISKNQKVGTRSAETAAPAATQS